MLYLEVEDQQAHLVLDQDGADALMRTLARLRKEGKFDHDHFMSQEWGGDGELKGNAAADGCNRVEHLKVVFLPEGL